MTVTFAGVDGEMSGPMVTRHRLVEIGVALDASTAFSSRIGWENCGYDLESLKVIRRTPEDLATGPNANVVDEALCDWLVDRGVTRHSLVPIGWGVTTFDLPFVLHTLPRFGRLLHHHAVELNAICYTLSDSRPYKGQLCDALTWKHMAKTAAAARLTFGYELMAREHEAEYDAIASLEAWRWLQEVIADPDSAAGR